MLYLTLFAAMFGMVALRAFQQLNVMHHRLKWVAPVSYGLAFFEVVVITHVAPQEAVWWGATLALGTGGGLGCFFSMWLHRKLR